MHKIELSYSLESRRARDALIRNPLLDLLHAVQSQGSISGAARVLRLSYRHVWGELKRWEGELERELIVWDRGQSARLTEFGEKLLWAERQAQARLAPQIEALTADLERAFAVAFDDAAHVLGFHASHDDALGALRTQAAQGARLHLDICFTGSVDAIRALNQGRCVMAGFHVPPHAEKGSLAERTYRPLLKPGRHKLIGFARRTQGVAVARGNPLAIGSLADVADGRVRYVNRGPGTGTRLLLDDWLETSGTLPGAIRGYELTEPSHAAVAQAVVSNAADAGLCIEPVARSRGLDFVPVADEEYYLVCLNSTLESPATQALLEVLKSPEWQARLTAMPGYCPSHSGEVLAMSRVLPWWKLRPKQSARTATALP
ncbi:MAG: substrate-binding domain-containing protein [Burkholderiaceae bacterium]